MKVLLALALVLALVPLTAVPAMADPAVAGEYPIAGGIDTNAQITLGPDGAMWVPVGAGNDVARIASDGSVAEFDAADISFPVGMVAGPDGNLWVTQSGAVARFSPATPTAATKFPIAELADPRAIAVGGDGNLWTASGDKVVRIPPSNPAGYAVFAVAGMSARWIAPASDGSLWVADFGGRIINVSLSGVPVPYPAAGGPQGVAAGPGGLVAFSNPGATPQVVGRLTAGGTPALTATPNADPFGVALGGDGAFWFAQFAANSLGRLAPEGTYTTLAGFTAAAGPRQLAAGPGNTLWVVLDTADRVAKVTGVVTPPPPQPTPSVGNPAPVALAAIAGGTKLRVTITSACPRQFAFRVQRGVIRGGVVTKWRAASKVLRTRGVAHKRTLNRGKGVYRVVVRARCGFDRTTSAPVALRR